MFAHSYSKLSRTCYGESTQYALQKSSGQDCRNTSGGVAQLPSIHWQSALACNKNSLAWCDHKYCSSHCSSAVGYQNSLHCSTTLGHDWNILLIPFCTPTNLALRTWKLYFVTHWVHFCLTGFTWLA